MRIKKISLITLLCLSLQGCPLEGDSGKKGADGVAGINCWDLNEDHSKTFPEEDSNQDGNINVLDCRVGYIPANGSTVVVDSSSQSITQTHSRVAYSTALTDKKIRIYSGTILDIPDDENWPLLDPLVVDPIDDPCGLWKWTDEWNGTSMPGEYYLFADGALEYDVEHFAAVAASGDGSNHFGYEACIGTCLASEQCVGASYFRITDNTLSCKLLLKPSLPVATGSSFYAFLTSERGFSVATMDTDPTSSGLISVCEAP